MIRPDGFRGAAFGTTVEGDARNDENARRSMSRELGIPDHWASVTQVHGSDVVEAVSPGKLGEADAIYTTVSGLPASVGYADCVPIIVEGPDVVAVIHAGWRGAAAGLVEQTLDAMTSSGHTPVRAAIGPAIGPCCYEVDDEVAAHFPFHVAETTWGSASVDLPSFVADRMNGLEVWRSAVCTFMSPDVYSYRRDRTKKRQVAVGWLPIDSH